MGIDSYLDIIRAWRRSSGGASFNSLLGPQLAKDLRSVSPSMVVRVSPLLEALMAGGCKNAVGALACKHDFETGRFRNLFRNLFHVICLYVASASARAQTIYPSKFESAMKEVLQDDEHALDKDLHRDSYAHASTQHVRLALGMLRTCALEDLQPVSMQGMRVRRYPKSG